MGQEKDREEIKKFLEANENKLRKTQNIWDRAKVVLRWKFIAIQAFPVELEEQQETKPRTSRRKEIIKIREELNDIETKKYNSKDP